jgi:hypothetical protein
MLAVSLGKSLDGISAKSSRSSRSAGMRSDRTTLRFCASARSRLQHGVGTPVLSDVVIASRRQLSVTSLGDQRASGRRCLSQERSQGAVLALGFEGRPPRGLARHQRWLGGSACRRSSTATATRGPAAVFHRHGLNVLSSAAGPARPARCSSDAASRRR